MKKLLGILVLGLLLTSCSAGSIYGNKYNFKSTLNYQSEGFLTPKDHNADPIIVFHGYGNTKESAAEEAEKAFMAYKKTMSKDSLLKYEGYSSGETKMTRSYRRQLSAERKAKKEEQRAKEEKEAFIAKIEPKKKECAAIGFEPGTEKFYECILRLLEMEGNKDIAKRAREQEYWKSILLLQTGTTTSTSGGTSCFKSSETLSGTNKICYYSCMGSTKTLNISSMQICPLTANF